MNVFLGMSNLAFLISELLFKDSICANVDKVRNRSMEVDEASSRHGMVGIEVR